MVAQHIASTLEPSELYPTAMSDTQIMGYAEPWIVSPGEPVNIKVRRTLA